MTMSRTADLLEANEHLVLAVLRAQEEATEANSTLHELRRALGMAAATGAVDAPAIPPPGARAGVGAAQRLLGLAARRLGDTVRDADVVTRLGDHEFLVQLTSLSQPSHAVQVAEAVLAALALPIALGGREVRLKAHVGVSVYPVDGDNADALVDRATAAIHHARREGLGSYAFHGEPGTNARCLELRRLDARQQATPPAAAEPADADAKAEVNQQFVLAALLAQELLAAAELVQREQSAFMGVVAHELRGPLEPLSHEAALLGRGGGGGLLLRNVQRMIDRQVGHLGRLVTDLLDVTRLHTGKLRLEVQRLALQAVRADCRRRCPRSPRAGNAWSPRCLRARSRCSATACGSLRCSANCWTTRRSTPRRAAPSSSRRSWREGA